MFAIVGTVPMSLTRHSPKSKTCLMSKFSLQTGEVHSKLGAMFTRAASQVVTMTMSMPFRMGMSARVWEAM